MSRRAKITYTESDEELYEQWYQMLLMIGYNNDKRRNTATANKRNRGTATQDIRIEAPRKRGRPLGSKTKSIPSSKKSRTKRNTRKRRTT